MEETLRTFIPAAGHDWLLPLYDPFCKWMGGESLHRQLVDQADIRPSQRVLEIGCGTGSLAILVKRLHPGAEVVGLDPDRKALTRARRKTERDALSVQLDRGFSDELPYADASFDRVLSAFMFHHPSYPRRRRRCTTHGGCSSVVDPCTCSTSEALTRAQTALSRACSTEPRACGTTWKTGFSPSCATRIS